MNDTSLIDQIAQLVIAQLPKPIPIEHQLWSHKEIAEYLKASVKTVADQTVKRADFPKSIKPPLSPDSEEGRPRYYAREVIAWAAGNARARKRIAA